MSRDNSVIGIGRRNQCRRIANPTLEIVIRRILQQCGELFGNFGTSEIIRPESACRELLESQHIHDSHPGKTRAVEIWSLSHTGSHKQAAVAAALNSQLL